MTHERVTARGKRRVRVDEDLLTQALVLIAEDLARQQEHRRRQKRRDT